MAVFTTREAAEAFAARDPFVSERIVARWTIREWNEALATPAPGADRVDPVPS